MQSYFQLNRCDMWNTYPMNNKHVKHNTKRYLLRFLNAKMFHQEPTVETIDVNFHITYTYSSFPI